MMMMMIVDLYSTLRKVPMCPGALWKEMFSVPIEKIRCWAMGHLGGQVQAIK